MEPILTELHTRYDGLLPPAALEAWRATRHPGGRAGLCRTETLARARLFDDLARKTIDAVAARRTQTHKPALGTLAQDLMFFRKESLRLLDAAGA